jgi:hypothetical protein
LAVVFRAGIARLLVVAVLALLLAGGYTAYAGDRVYQSLQSGRQELVAAQAKITAAQHSGDVAQLQSAATQLAQAERDFTDAEQRARTDPGLRIAGSVDATQRQIDGAAHLAAIGADLSRAGEAAAAIALQVAQLKQHYAGRPLTPDDLQALLQQAQAIAVNYKGSIDQIGRELKAAHAERTQVTTTGLVSPLRSAYDQVDRALDEADTAFLRYQDVRRVLSDLLNVPLPG